jgi:hypothetical protein
MKRIYDAAFANSNGVHHSHLGTFWWIDDNDNTGQWTRPEAYSYVVANPRGVYVSENNRTVLVGHREDETTGTHWIQTYADGYWRDNLTALAVRHSQGLVNR